MLLYHPELDRTFETGNDSDAQFEILAKSGWRKTIPAEHNPALAAEQPDDEVVYQPVLADEAKPRGKATKSAKEAAPTD
jgi:hypothetical protein